MISAEIVQKARLHPDLRDGKARLGIQSVSSQVLTRMTKCYLGIFESTKWHAATEEQIAEAIELATKYPNIVEYVIVGNECLDQDFADGAVSVEQLIADINKVKQSVPANVKVTTCLGFHSALNPQKMEDGSPNPYSGRARIMESGSCRSQKPIA